MKVRDFTRLIIMLGALCLTIVSSCGDSRTNERLTVFHAGSLSVPFRKIADDFERENPGVKVM
ncbi:MAG TPA: hypothetical protein VLA34_12895, partial [Candidatus Krumholzibacterium sp.]|nr:hypothetical protein [Candidatus Krumholzibacterium sp.]